MVDLLYIVLFVVVTVNGIAIVLAIVRAIKRLDYQPVDYEIKSRQQRSAL
jgi:hypothetical protein